MRDGTVFARLAEHEHWSAGPLPDVLAWSTAARLIAGRRAYAARELEPLWSDTQGEPFRTTLALLEAFRGVAGGLGARLVVLVFPMRTDLELLLAGGRRYWSTLPAALDERGIAFVDVADILVPAAREPGGVPALYATSHFSPLGNDLVARALVPWLAHARSPSEPK